MTEKKENVQRDKNIDPKEREKLESVRKADAAVKTMQDFTSPEVLYQELITSVRKYHPSTDITMIQKARKENPGNHISFTHFAWQSFLQIWNWIRKQSLQVFFMMQWKIHG